MWNCTACNESIEDNFEVCWNCKTPKDGEPPDDLASDEFPKELEPLRELMQKSADEDLKRIVNVDFEQYGKEAVLLAQEELDRRHRPALQPEASVRAIEDDQRKQGISLSDEKPSVSGRDLITVGIIIAIIGVGLIMVSPIVDPKVRYLGGNRDSLALSLKDLALMGGVAFLVIGGIVAALGFSKSGSAQPTPPRPPAESSAPLKTCPECAESVKSAARICRFCGHNFS